MTARHGHAPIAMRRTDQPFDQVGDFKWYIGKISGKRILTVAIPTIGGKGWIHSRWSIDHKNVCGAQWSWDGNEDAPTLTPSLHAVGIWHGWVRAGQLIEA